MHNDNQHQLTTTPEHILICQFQAAKPQILRGEDLSEQSGLSLYVWIHIITHPILFN